MLEQLPLAKITALSILKPLQMPAHYNMKPYGKLMKTIRCLVQQH